MNSNACSRISKSTSDRNPICFCSRQSLVENASPIPLSRTISPSSTNAPCALPKASAVVNPYDPRFWKNPDEGKGVERSADAPKSSPVETIPRPVGHVLAAADETQPTAPRGRKVVSVSFRANIPSTGPTAAVISVPPLQRSPFNPTTLNFSRFRSACQQSPSDRVRRTPR